MLIQISDYFLQLCRSITIFSIGQISDYFANCRYENEDSNGNQAGFLNAGKKPSDCKMVAKATFSFSVSATN